MFGSKDIVDARLTAAEWAQQASEEVPRKARFAGADRGAKLAYANYCATMAVYEQMREMAESLRH